MDGRAVPKFGSFKPKASPKPIASDSQPTSKSKQSSDYEKDSRRHGHDESSRRHHYRRGSEERRSRHGLFHRRRSREVHAKTPEVEAPIAVDELEESDLFIIDRRGDAKNVEYGSLHRYTVPLYRRVGYGKVLGLAMSKKIDRDESNDREIRLTSADGSRGQRQSRPLTSKYGKLTESKLRFVVSTLNEDPTGGDFIDLRPSRKRKRGSESPATGPTTVDYRSVEGKAKAPAEPEDDDIQAASKSDSEDVDLGLQTRQENAILSRKTKECPTNFDAWLALVNHQAKLVRPGVEPVVFTGSERRTLADLRLSILNKAASSISKSDPDRERLLHATIAEGSVIWDSAKRAAKWKEALRECPKSTLLWTDYLSYVQDSHAAFKYDTCKETYLQCLNMLDEAHRKEGNNNPSISCIQIHVLLRLTAFIRDAGYEELSIGIWQALFEYHFRMPLRLEQSPVSDRLAAFEDFWESEVPRIGEQDSKGWASFDENDDSELRNPPRLKRTSPDPKRLYASFAEEESRLQRFVLSASTSDDDATSDPFRCVMYSDISGILELVGSDLPRRMLIDAFLGFLGLPGLPSTEVDSQARAWTQDSHLVGGSSTETTWRETAIAADSVKMQCREETTDSLFDDAFEIFTRTINLGDNGNDGTAGFVDRALNTLAAADPEDDVLVEYCLACKLQMSAADAAKLAKRLLKQRPSSLRLYNAYALIEAKRGSLDKAQSVWSTALSARLASSGSQDDTLLWHSRMISQCRAGDEVAALKGISELADEAAQNANSQDNQTGLQIRRLKSRRLLEERLDEAILRKRPAYAALTVDCLAWMEYLADDHDISTALQVYAKYGIRFEKNGLLMTIEQLQQCKAGMLKMHMKRKRPFKPASFRQELEQGLKMFPSNSMLLNLHASIVAQDRLRTLVFDQKVFNSTSMSIIQWSYRLADELRRCSNEASGSTSNTVRATFSKALLSTDSLVSHSPALWMMWLRFEHGQLALLQGAKKQEAARTVKRVFLDGLRNLPWVKQWIIMGMKLLSNGVLSEGEMRQAYEVLGERGLRLRVDIEDMM